MTSPTLLTSSTLTPSQDTTRASHLLHWLLPFCIGLILPLGFAPFHFPGLAILSLALFYLLLQQTSPLKASINGLCFGLGYFGFGVSWIYVSIHAYGHLHPLFAGLITLLFILYLALYTSFLAWIYTTLKKRLTSPLQSAISFSCIWMLIEYARATCFTGFPWLLIGIGQFDSPLQAYIPLIGIYGTGFITCFIATCLAHAMSPAFSKRILWLSTGLLLLLSAIPLSKEWTKTSPTPLSVGIIQANLSMRDKWDEKLFWSILSHYEKQVKKLLGTDLIVMPESAIPLPASYVLESLEKLHHLTSKAHSALIFGMPALKTHGEESHYYNALFALGQAKGTYLKQHLVPFGEYIPLPFQAINRFLGLPDSELSAGSASQKLVTVHHHPIASLICYELAYAELLRAQLPQAEWIISLSDDGWFGHSLAIYQQLQIAQVRSLQTGRFQVVSNNDGRSSVLNTKGEIVSSLPAFASEVLKSTLYPATGLTPWTKFGDMPILILISLVLFAQISPSILRQILNFKH